jgi:uncharacterized protein YjbI with pentapeptide repeats
MAKRREDRWQKSRLGRLFTANREVGSADEELIDRSATGSQGIKAGIGDLGADLPNTFEGVDLSHMDKGSTFETVKFDVPPDSGKGVDFSKPGPRIESDFENRDFSQMDRPSTLSSTNLKSSSDGVDFNKVDFTKVNFTKFKSTKFEFAENEDGKSELAGKDLSHMDEGSTFYTNIDRESIFDGVDRESIFDPPMDPSAKSRDLTREKKGRNPDER